MKFRNLKINNFWIYGHKYQGLGDYSNFVFQITEKASNFTIATISSKIISIDGPDKSGRNWRVNGIIHVSLCHLSKKEIF